MIGIGSLMGIRPPENFDFPFLARNVSEYWLRVHRSLTQWLTDYIFTPSYKFALEARVLARHGFVALAASLMVTMVVAGLWHGTTANFLVFGLIHGAALVVMRGYEWTMTGWLGRARFRGLRESPVMTVAAVLRDLQLHVSGLHLLRARCTRGDPGSRASFDAGGDVAMTRRGRITIKLLWMLALVAMLTLLGQVRYDFVYQAF